MILIAFTITVTSCVHSIELPQLVNSALCSSFIQVILPAYMLLCLHDEVNHENKQKKGNFRYPNAQRNSVIRDMLDNGSTVAVKAYSLIVFGSIGILYGVYAIFIRFF